MQKVFLILIVLCGIAVGFMLTDFNVVGISILFLILLFASQLYVRRVAHSYHSGLIYKLFYISLCIRLLFMVFLQVYLHFTTGSNVIEGGDAYDYVVQGELISNSIREGYFSLNSLFRIVGGSNNFAYSFLNGVIYYCFGVNVILMKILNLFISSLTVIVAYQIAFELFSGKVAKITGYVTAFNLELIVWSGVNLKDVLFGFLIAISALSLIIYIKYGRWNNLLLYVVFSLFAFSTRDTHGILWIFISTVYLLINGKKNVRKAVTAIGTLCLALFIISLYIPSMKRWIDSLSKGQFYQELYYYHHSTMDRFGYDSDKASLVSGVRFNSPFEIAKVLPLGVAKLLFTPLPWKAKGFFRFLILGAFMRYFLYPLMVLGMYWSIVKDKKNVLKKLILIFFIITTIFVIATVELGGTPRHQISILPLGIIFSAVAIVHFRYFKGAYLLIMLSVLSMLTAYFFYSELM